MHGLDRYLARAGSTGLVNAASSALAVAVGLPFVIAHAGLDAYGFWALSLMFVNVAALLDFGLSKSIIIVSADDTMSRDQLMSSATAIGLAAAAVLALLVTVVAMLGWPLFGEVIARHAGLSLWIAASGSMLLCCSVLTTLLRALLEAQLKLELVNLGFGLQTILNYLVVALAAYWSGDARIMMLGTCAVYVAILLLHLLLVARHAPFRWHRPGLAQGKLLIRLGLPAYVAELPLAMFAPLLQYLFSLRSPSAAWIGVYDLAIRISGLCATAVNSLSQPFFVAVARSRPDTGNDVRGAIIRHLRFTITAAALLWVAFLVAGPVTLRWLLADVPPDLYRTTLIILLGAAAMSACEPIARMLLGLGKRRVLLANRLLMLATALATGWTLRALPVIDGFAIAYSAGMGIAAIGFAVLNHREPWGRLRSTVT